MSDDRMTLKEADTWTHNYFLTNCQYFTDSKKMITHGWELDLVNALIALADMDIFFLSRDKHKKQVVKDIALQALHGYRSAWNAGDYQMSRKFITDGHNGVLRQTFGNEMFSLIQKSYEAECFLISHSPAELDDTDGEMLMASGRVFRHEGISMGLLQRR